MKRIVIVANGNLWKSLVKEIESGDVIIGVDRAAYWLITKGITPDVAIGDFDSVTEHELAVIKQKVKTIKHYKPEKDFTDTELALRYAFRLHPTSIIFFGGSGSRLDHTIGTLQLLEQSKKRGISAVFCDEHHVVVLVDRGRTILKKREGYRYVSVLPVTASIEITLSKFKYEIDHLTICRGKTRGISNEFVGNVAEITLYRGKALVVQSRD